MQPSTIILMIVVALAGLFGWFQASRAAYGSITYFLGLTALPLAWLFDLWLIKRHFDQGDAEKADVARCLTVVCVVVVWLALWGSLALWDCARHSAVAGGGCRAVADSIVSYIEGSMGKDLIMLVVGGLTAFYGTIVFERYKLFMEVLRDIALARVHFEGYPISENDIDRALSKADAMWRRCEEKAFLLDCFGQASAAAEIRKLHSFYYRATACMEHMSNDRRHGRGGTSTSGCVSIRVQ